MAEYIDKEALKESFWASCNNCLSEDDIADLIDEIPAADVAPVVHGNWVSCFEDWRKQIEGDKCSSCGFEHYGTNIRSYNFCPNCGAKMDLEDEQNDRP